jgi:hypothetical protein
MQVQVFISSHSLLTYALVGLSWAPRSDTFPHMRTVKEIESAITQLKPREIRAVAEWLLEYRETLWDKKIAADPQARKLDPLIKKAKSGQRTGNLYE